MAIVVTWAEGRDNLVHMDGDEFLKRSLQMDNEWKMAVDEVLYEEMKYIRDLILEDRDDELADYLMSILGLDSMTAAQIKERWSSIFSEKEE